MRAGAEVIYQATFLRDGLRGHADYFRHIRDAFLAALSDGLPASVAFYSLGTSGGWSPGRADRKRLPVKAVQRASMDSFGMPRRSARDAISMPRRPRRPNSSSMYVSASMDEGPAIGWRFSAVKVAPTFGADVVCMSRTTSAASLSSSRSAEDRVARLAPAARVDRSRSLPLFLRIGERVQPPARFVL